MNTSGSNSGSNGDDGEGGTNQHLASGSWRVVASDKAGWGALLC